MRPLTYSTTRGDTPHRLAGPAPHWTGSEFIAAQVLKIFSTRRWKRFSRPHSRLDSFSGPCTRYAKFELDEPEWLQAGITDFLSTHGHDATVKSTAQAALRRIDKTAIKDELKAQAKAEAQARAQEFITEAFEEQVDRQIDAFGLNCLE